MSRETIKQLINSTVTSQTEPSSITPGSLGGTLDFMVDELATKEEVDEATNISNASYYPLPEGVTELPVPPLTPQGQPMEVAWTFLKQGVTYTQEDGDPITGVVGRENKGQWDGTTWSLKDMGELPQAPLADDFGSSVEEAATQRLVTEVKQGLDAKLPINEVKQENNVFFKNNNIIGVTVDDVTGEIKEDPSGKARIGWIDVSGLSTGQEIIAFLPRYLGNYRYYNFYSDNNDQVGDVVGFTNQTTFTASKREGADKLVFDVDPIGSYTQRVDLNDVVVQLGDSLQPNRGVVEIGGKELIPYNDEIITKTADNFDLSYTHEKGLFDGNKEEGLPVFIAGNGVWSASASISCAIVDLTGVDRLRVNRGAQAGTTKRTTWLISDDSTPTTTPSYLYGSFSESSVIGDGVIEVPEGANFAYINFLVPEKELTLVTDPDIIVEEPSKLKEDRLPEVLLDRIDTIERFVLPENKNIILAGASYAYNGNGWFELACEANGWTGLNKAVSGSTIMDTANALYKGTLYTNDELSDSDAFVIMQVHNVVVSDNEGILETPGDYEIAYANGLNLEGMSDSQCYDYCIKKYMAERTAIDKPTRIVLTTSWHDGRVIYNDSVRELAEKWGFNLVEFDKHIGFSRNQKNPTYKDVDNNILHQSVFYANYPSDSTAPGRYTNVSHGGVIRRMDTQVQGGEVMGHHPARGRDKEIQKRMASIFAATIKYLN